MTDVVDALNALGITDEFVVDSDVTTEEHYKRSFKDISGQNRFIEWSKVKSKMEELQADYDSKKYQRDRAVAYDPIPEQLDQIYHDMDGWKKRIKSVKDKFPKPSE